MTISRIFYDIDLNLYRLGMVRYHWLNIPNSWTLILKLLEGYISQIVCRPIGQEFPPKGVSKCNTDGSSKGNPRPGSWAFFIKNHIGEFIYASENIIPRSTSLYAEAKAIKKDIKYCVNQHLLPLIVETDSLTIKRIIEAEWKTPWRISIEVKRIREWRNKEDISLIHTMR